jgi:hypothetical protein
VVVDNTAPTALSALDLAAVDDTFGAGTTGTNSDNITKNTSALTISGSGETGATVTLFDDANNNGVVDGGESLGTTTVSGGSFSLDVSLVAGTHNVRAIQTDVAGNASVASTTHALDITVDTTANAPTALDLAAVDDTFGAGTTGTNSDNITKNTSALTISGSGENGAAVTLFDDANNNGVVDGGESLGTTTVSGGSFSLDVSLAEGTHNVRAIQTDVAGNVSAASATHALDITVDTTANAPTALDLAAADDTGTLNSDNITKNTSALTISGSGENGAAVTLFDDANNNGLVDGGESLGTITVAGGAFTLDVSLAAGTHNIRAIQTDVAGNASAASTTHALDITVDTTVATPSAPDMTAATDSGQSSTDNVTNDATPTFTGSGAEAAATVTLFDTNGTTVLGTGIADGSGNWSITSSTLSSGGHTLTAKQTDIAGNISGASASLAVTIDTAPPTTLSWSYSNGQSKLSASTDASNVWKVTVHDNTSPADYNATLQSAGTWTLTQSGLNNHSLTVTEFDVAGNTLVSTHTAPAGVTASSINLALADLTGSQGEVTLTITGAPSDWTINGATNNSDGSWTVVTNDVGSLTVTTPVTYTGALLLNVAETWVNADGSIGTAMVVDNVEAYAPGSPIFALSGDDFLTGSSGHDVFVFSQPIGHDVIYSFDAASDQIDLIGYANFTGFGDIQSHMTDDAAGNAVITLADGQSITLNGVDGASLTAGDFVFDQTPVTENAGHMVISDGAILPLSGIIDNTGTIELNSTGDETDLQLIEHGITLQGGGHVDLSDSSENVITGTVSDVTLTNVDNTISGAGHLGDGVMVLVNEGTIVATGTNALDIDTGANAVTNTGTLEATGTGGLEVHSDIINTGVLWANGGNVTIDGNVSGNGTAQISGSATLEFGAASAANVALGAQATGTIVLHDSFDFSGVVSGFNGDDHLDLLDVSFGAGTTASYLANQAGTGGTLSVTDGVHTANITLLGQYDPAGFQTEADKNTGTLISYHDHLA